MKTFKLISLQVVEEYGLIDINLEDGLIINKEDDARTWLVEAYVSNTYEDYFQVLLKADKEITVQVVISRKENDPAYFQAKLLSIKNLGVDHIHLLLKGSLNRSRNNYAELLLTNLIEKGLSGTDLLTEFKEKMISKPLLTPKKK